MHLPWLRRRFVNYAIPLSGGPEFFGDAVHPLKVKVLPRPENLLANSPH
jgi:hypothetical protein